MNVIFNFQKQTKTMKTSKTLAMIAAVGLLVVFSSCSNDDETVDNNQPQAVRFSAGIANQALPAGGPTTKAAGTDWASGDAIGIFMVNFNTTSIAEGAENKQFTTTGTSEFTAAAGNEITYPMNAATKVDFIAYYPYASGNVLTTPIDVTIGLQTNQPTFDLLWTKADNGGAGYDKNTHKNTKVELKFDHKLAKIVMNVKADANTGITDLSTATVTINGMFTKNTFNLATGLLGTADTKAAITPRKLGTKPAGFLATYDAIIMPYSNYAANDVTVVFTVGGNPYTWTLKTTDAVFAPGNEYTYEVTLTKTKVLVKGTITPWLAPTNNDRGPVTAE